MLKQKNINIFFEKNTAKNILLILITCLSFVGFFFLSTNFSHAFKLPSGTGKVNSKEGAVVRKLPSTNSNKISWANNNASLKIKDMVFTTTSNTRKKNVWYHVTVNNETGYIRSDLVDSLKFVGKKTTTTDKVNYRNGAGTGMKKIGTLKKGASLTICLPTYAKSSPIIWYRAIIKNKVRFISAKYVSYNGNPNLNNKCPCATALLKNATSGGSVRKVFTFDSNNCIKKLTTKAESSSTCSHVPQALAFSGSNYYVLYAMNGESQYIIRYNPDGSGRKRFSTGKKGHLNGMTWDANSKKIIYTKGLQYTVYTLDPSNGKFSTATTTPHSNSGVGYDKKKKYMIFSSKTAINTYMADGIYTCTDEFERCSRSGTYYVQDCCAQNGFVFHCVSIGDKTGGNNYIDVYRVIDGKYMGSIQVKLGEIESAIVNNKGYLEILINATSWTDYVWRTPLKISDLKG